jgi:hypothetical protein
LVGIVGLGGLRKLVGSVNRGSVPAVYEKRVMLVLEVAVTVRQLAVAGLLQHTSSFLGQRRTGRRQSVLHLAE